jgi:ubiquinone/menaquinone biosynthesis C-methylase UbiE
MQGDFAGAFKTLSTNHHQDDVREHYRRLASEYGARANRTCEQMYFRLIQRFLRNRRNLLEVGSGSNDALDRLNSPFAVACDQSQDMLRLRSSSRRSRCVVAAGEMLPFHDARFDGVYLINVLEHVADLDAVLAECARVLEEDGIWIAITPNGKWEFWLDLAERWSLKIPEGPHTFLTPQKLRVCVQKWFEVVEQRTFLLMPFGPPSLVGLIDNLTVCAAFGAGFFQFVVARKRRSTNVTPQVGTYAASNRSPA